MKILAIALFLIVLPLAAGANGYDAPTDYDGDDRSDLVVYYPANGTWYIYYTGSKKTVAIPFGFSGAQPVAGDFDGNGNDDLAIYYNGYWYIRRVGGKILCWGLKWGWAGATPVCGDYDGDGADDLCVYDGSGGWYVYSLKLNKVLYSNFRWGFAGGIPVAGRYDGDAKYDFAVVEPTFGNYFIWGSVMQDTWGWNVGGLHSGPNTDLVFVSGDTGDQLLHYDDCIVYQKSIARWVEDYSNEWLTEGLVTWGFSGAIPLVIDYNGDQVGDRTVYDPATGDWYILYYSATWALKTKIIRWGFPGAVPVKR